jgi:hypothetical protein
MKIIIISYIIFKRFITYIIYNYTFIISFLKENVLYLSIIYNEFEIVIKRIYLKIRVINFFIWLIRV